MKLYAKVSYLKKGRRVTLAGTFPAAIDTAPTTTVVTNIPAPVKEIKIINNSLVSKF